MTIQHILSKECRNTNSIHLLKDGLFWRAWERSAFRFTAVIKPYRLTKKFIKRVNCEVVYCGFPSNSLKEVLALVQDKTLEESETEITISGFEPIDNKTFDEWKNDIPLIEKRDQPKPVSTNDKTALDLEILERVRSFQLANSTPMECQQFLMEIQSQLNGTI